LIGLHGYGTYQRNEVWKNDETLWKDVTVKSPDNGRGQMNYGLALMAKGEYVNAEKYFNRTLELWPSYSYGFVNMGILKDALGKSAEAEHNFQRSIQCDPMNPETYYYYANFLHKHQRNEEAIPLLQKTMQISSAHTQARSLLMNIYAEEYRWAELKFLCEETLKIFPGDLIAVSFLEASKNGKSKSEMALEQATRNPTPENYLNLSLISYQENDFRGCIKYAAQSLKLKPDYSEAYNNIGSAYSMMAKFDSAEIALKQAIHIRPDYPLAINNIRLAEKRKSQVRVFMDAIKSNPTEQSYLSLSLYFYREGMYAKCIESAQDALKINPKSADAYNNICSAYNNLKKWDKAIEACNRAVELKPDFQLAKNNLQFAMQRKDN
jgi:tetratricopeptide (TPR) repeat protein